MSVVVFYQSAWLGLLALALVALGLAAIVWVRPPRRILKALAVAALVAGGGYLSAHVLVFPAPKLAIAHEGVACAGGQARWGDVSLIERHVRSRPRFVTNTSMLIHYAAPDGRILVRACRFDWLAQGRRGFTIVSSEEIERLVRAFGLAVNPSLKLKNWPGAGE